MNTDRHEAGHRFLVVNENVVVAEDLKEILSEFGAERIDVFRSLDDGFCERYAAAFFAVSVSSLSNDRRVQAMLSNGTKIVVLGSDSDDMLGASDGLLGLQLPFRSDDVSALLKTLDLGESPKRNGD